MATKAETRKSYPGVRKREGSQKWEWRVRVNKHDYTDSGYPTAKSAYEAREQFKVEMKSKGVSVINCNKTMKDVYEEFLEEQGISRAYSTIKKYKSLWEHHIGPAFSGKLIKDITPADLEDYFIKLGKEQKERKHGKEIIYSKGHIDAIRKLLNNIFKRALNRRYIPSNPLTNISKDMYNKLGKEAEEGTYLEPNIVSILAERFSDSPLLCSFMLGFHTGMRIGEVFGLLESDLDFDNQIIKVRRQLIYIKPLWVLAPLKTKAARRDIKMTTNLYTFLKIWIAKQKENKAIYKDSYTSIHKVGLLHADNTYTVLEKELPFINVKEDGKLLTPGSATYMCKVAREELGIKNFSFHDLRHTHLTDLANAGYPPIELKKRAGHEKITTTINTYYHTNNNSQDVATALLNKVEIKDFEVVKREIEEQNHLAAEWNMDIPDELLSDNQLSSVDMLGGEFTSNGFVSKSLLKESDIKAS